MPVSRLQTGRAAAPATGELGKRYKAMELDRQPFLDAARRASLLTDPALIPHEGWVPGSKLPTPYQSLGARGLNTLSSKLLLGLFPPNISFVDLVLDPFVAERQAIEDGRDLEEIQAEIQDSLGKIQETIQLELDQAGYRARMEEAFEHLILGGNVVVYRPTAGDQPPQLYHLDQFVVSRDSEENLLEIIIYEVVALDALSDDLRAAVEAANESEGQGAEEVETGANPEVKEYPVYTQILRNEDGNFTLKQEVGGVEVPESEADSGPWDPDEVPYFHVRWRYVSGQPYGRGHVARFEGDLTSLEGLSQAVVEGSAVAAKLLMLVDPNGLTRISSIVKAPNGAVRHGRTDDVGMLQAEKRNDFATALEQVRDLTLRIRQGFLMTSAGQRDAERVTAEEIQTVQRELQESFGGTYSLLAEDLQLPLAKRILRKLVSENRIPNVLGSDAIKVKIVTGLAALGQSQDFDLITSFVASVAQLLQEEGLQHINARNVVSQLARSSRLAGRGLLLSEEQVAQRSQMAQLQNLVEKLGPNGIQAVSQMAQRLLQERARAGGGEAAAAAPAAGGAEAGSDAA